MELRGALFDAFCPKPYGPRIKQSEKQRRSCFLFIYLLFLPSVCSCVVCRERRQKLRDDTVYYLNGGLSGGLRHNCVIGVCKCRSRQDSVEAITSVIIQTCFARGIKVPALKEWIAVSQCLLVILWGVLMNGIIVDIFRVAVLGFKGASISNVMIMVLCACGRSQLFSGRGVISSDGGFDLQSCPAAQVNGESEPQNGKEGVSDWDAKVQAVSDFFNAMEWTELAGKRIRDCRSVFDTQMFKFRVASPGE